MMGMDGMSMMRAMQDAAVERPKSRTYVVTVLDGEPNGHMCHGESALADMLDLLLDQGLMVKVEVFK